MKNTIKPSKPNKNLLNSLTFFSMLCGTLLFFAQTLQANVCAAHSGAAMVPSAPLPKSPSSIIGAAGQDSANCLRANDTSKISVRTYGYFSYSTAPDGHKGDPLGSGGKLPMVYNLQTGRESSAEQPTYASRDLRIQYSDFGYVPLWRSSVLLSSIRTRFSENLSGNFGVAYGGELGQPGTAMAPGQFGISEANLVWAPKKLPGLSVRAGNVLDLGEYCDVYDQLPVENFVYTGLIASYYRRVNNALGLNYGLGGGGTLQNVTVISDNWHTKDVYPSTLIHAARNRTYLNARITALVYDKLTVKLSGGLQHVPADSMQTSEGKPDSLKKYMAADGWFTALETTVYSKNSNHTFSLLYGVGDVLTGSGTPDFVRYTTPNRLWETLGDPQFSDWYSKKNSRILSGAYWSTSNFKRLSISTGIWGIWRLPAKNDLIEQSGNSYIADTTLIQFGLPATGVSSDSNMLVHNDTVRLFTEPTAAIKLCIFPSWKVCNWLYIGARLDYIDFLTPNAHTNAQEPIRDQTLRRPADLEAYYQLTGKELYAPAKWEREAVNSLIISPQATFTIDDIGGFTLAYAQAFYDTPVDRQGTISNRHSNIIVSAFINYQFKR